MKMRLAVNALLSEPDEISGGLEAELYALRDRLDVLELTAHSRPGRQPQAKTDRGLVLGAGRNAAFPYDV